VQLFFMSCLYDCDEWAHGTGVAWMLNPAHSPYKM